jgi:hypothetical protein
MQKIVSLFAVLSIVLGVLCTFTVFAEETASDIIEISTLAELEQFRDDVNRGNTYKGKTVKLTADIDMSEKYGEGKESWTPIGTFAGTFEGAGQKIANLYYYNSIEEFDVEHPVGFFVYNNGTIKNLCIEGSVTHMKYSVVGGIAAESHGIIENCYNAGNIIKMTEEDSSLFRESEFLGSITGCSVNGKDVTDCFYLEGTYARGVFFEDESGADTTVSLTTAQFADKNNFTNWDFDTVWEMDGALGRPVLRSNREQQYIETHTHTCSLNLYRNRHGRILEMRGRGLLQ